MRFIGEIRERSQLSQAKRRVSWYRCNRNKDRPRPKRLCSTGPDVTRRVPIHTLTRAWNSKRATGTNSSGHRAPYMENLLTIKRSIQKQNKERGEIFGTKQGARRTFGRANANCSKVQTCVRQQTRRCKHGDMMEPAQKCFSHFSCAICSGFYLAGQPLLSNVCRVSKLDLP